MFENFMKYSFFLINQFVIFHVFSDNFQMLNEIRTLI